MDKRSHRLGRKDWILAGFRALVAGGATALRIEPVARAIGATKGSFYWHFEGPADWRDAMLDHWRQAALVDVVTALSPIEDGEARVRELVRLATWLGRDAAHGGVQAEPALRAWAQGDEVVAAAVALVDQARLDFLFRCFRDAGVAEGKSSWCARVTYAAHIGQQALGRPPEEDASDLLGLIDGLLAK